MQLKTTMMPVYAVLAALIIVCLLAGGCTGSSPSPGTTPAPVPPVTATQTPAPAAVTETKSTVQGVVRDLGTLGCPCFTLANGSGTITVRYDLMKTDGGTLQPAVSVADISNGELVWVDGTRKAGGEFWATAIRKSTVVTTPVPTMGAVVTLPPDAESVSSFMKNRVYETKVSIWGEADSVNELNCPCFILTEKGTSAHIWYDMMVRPDGGQEPAVSIKGLKNGNRVLVTGVLKSGENGGTRNDFWATQITKVAG